MVADSTVRPSMSRMLYATGIPLTRMPVDLMAGATSQSLSLAMFLNKLFHVFVQKESP